MANYLKLYCVYDNPFTLCREEWINKHKQERFISCYWIEMMIENNQDIRPFIPGSFIGNINAVIEDQRPMT